MFQLCDRTSAKKKRFFYFITCYICMHIKKMQLFLSQCAELCIWAKTPWKCFYTATCAAVCTGMLLNVSLLGLVKTRAENWSSGIMFGFTQRAPLQTLQPLGSSAVSAWLLSLVLYLVPPQGRLWLFVNKYRGDVCACLSILRVILSGIYLTDQVSIQLEETVQRGASLCNWSATVLWLVIQSLKHTHMLLNCFLI